MPDFAHASGATDALLIFIPGGSNADATASLLARHGVACRICADHAALWNAIDDEVGAVLITEEALRHQGLDTLALRLERQPPWSDLPLIVLTRDDAAARRRLMESNLYELLGNVMFLETPLSTISLLSAVRSALRARRRQRQIGEHLAQQKVAAAALRESEARFRHMADSAPALIWMTDATGQVTFVNMHHSHVFGHRATDILRLGWSAVVLPEMQARYNVLFTDAFAARRPFSIETQVCDRDANLRWFRSEGVPRLDDEGRFLGYTGCGLDITERRLVTEDMERLVAERTAELSQALNQLHDEVLERERAEAALRQAQKMEAIGQLTGGIAHDFNNMLQGIAGSLELMELRISQGRIQDLPSFVGTARRSVERAARLTHRLLAFARRQTLSPSPVEPDRLVVEMEELIRRTVGSTIRLELRLRNGGWCVLCDPNQLESALLNLCINARDAMPDGGTLTIATSDRVFTRPDLPGQDDVSPGRFVEISVSDTGVGMSADVLAHAFEPFFTTKPFGQGTGLGLSQLYGFVSQSGGFVRLESTTQPAAGSEDGQHGTTVRLLLPWHADAADVPDEAPADPDVRVEAIRDGEIGRTVLVVEDETAVRSLIAEALRDLDYVVLEADDGSSGLRSIRSGEHIDLLLTDVGLPGLNGRQLADAAREQWPDLPVLFITGFPGTALVDMGTRPGMDVMGKPFTLDVLTARVRAMLGHDALRSMVAHR